VGILLERLARRRHPLRVGMTLVELGLLGVRAVARGDYQVHPVRAPAASMSRRRDPLNLFQPFENLPPNHENQLTRALLLVLRLCPIAHECWLSRLSAGRHLYELSQATFDTQLRDI